MSKGIYTGLTPFPVLHVPGVCVYVCLPACVCVCVYSTLHKDRLGGWVWLFLCMGEIPRLRQTALYFLKTWAYFKTKPYSNTRKNTGNFHMAEKKQTKNLYHHSGKARHDSSLLQHLHCDIDTSSLGNSPQGIPLSDHKSMSNRERRSGQKVKVKCAYAEKGNPLV